MGAVTTLSRADPTVDPGGQAAVTIKIRNSGSIVDRFDVDVVGPTAGWVQVDPPSLSLFPGVEGSATITWSPPRASNPRAGVYPFGIRVRPAADPAGSTVEEGRISVTPFTSVAADVVPVTSRGSKVGRHQVIVANRGNASSEVAVTAEDPDARLKLAVQPPRAVVAPDAKVGFGVRVEVDDPFPFGPEKARPFQIEVTAGRQAPIALRATMTQRPMLPGWIPPVAGVVALVAVLGVGAFLAKAGPFAPEATPSPSVAQVSTQPSSAAPSVAESQQPPSVPASASAPASVAVSQPPTPPPSPTAVQNEIRFQGLELEDADFRPEPNLAQREPLITFTTDGPGDITLNMTKNDANNGVPVRLCLIPDGGDRVCENFGGPGQVTAPNDEAGTRSWTAFARPTGGNSAPFVDLTLTFFANARSVTYTDNAVLNGDILSPVPGVNGFNAIVRAPPTPSLLSINTSFQEQPANFAWAQWVVGQPEPPLTPESGQFSKDVGPIPLAPGTFVQYRFVGQSTFDGSPVTYAVRFSW
jgi:hypothetical protein